MHICGPNLNNIIYKDRVYNVVITRSIYNNPMNLIKYHDGTHRVHCVYVLTLSAYIVVVLIV